MTKDLLVNSPPKSNNVGMHFDFKSFSWPTPVDQFDKKDVLRMLEDDFIFIASIDLLVGQHNGVEDDNLWSNLDIAA